MQADVFAADFEEEVRKIDEKGVNVIVDFGMSGFPLHGSYYCLPSDNSWTKLLEQGRYSLSSFALLR